MHRRSSGGRLAQEWVASPRSAGEQQLTHQRDVIVHRDNTGYGFTVSGDTPVSVLSVKLDGPAARAGVQMLDIIVKVNGKSVNQLNHQQVVSSITSSSSVLLTLESCRSPPRMPNGAASTPPQRPLPPIPNQQREITGPQPVDAVSRRHWAYKKSHTIQLMLEEEERHVDSLRAQLAAATGRAGDSGRLRTELSNAEACCRLLRQQLDSLSGPPAGEPAAAASPLTAAARSPTASLSPADTPPPLPQRNRAHTTAGGTPLSAAAAGRLDVPPALPPRTYRTDTASSAATGGATGDLQRSASSASAQNKSTSPARAAVSPTHQRTKSSPDPISLRAAIAKRRESPRRLSAAESMGDLGSGRHARSSHHVAGDADSPLFTPPGTPPPPYGGSTCDVASATAAGDWDRFDHEVSATDTSGSSPGMVQRVNQPHIMSIEDDDLSEQECGQEDHGPFNSLNNLLHDHAHLAVFMNYVISNCDPSSLFFYLISDLYKEGNAKDMRRWAYEIHSTFLVPDAVMRVNGIEEGSLLKIDEILLRDLDKEEKLRTIFQRARARAREDINDQLADFRGKRTAGLGAMFGPKDSELEEARHDKAREGRIIEDVLVKLLETVHQSSELENASEQTQTQASSLATILYKYFNYRSPSLQQIVESCPLFVSKERSFKSKLLNRHKKPPVVRGHQFQLHQYYIVTACNACQDSIRGISPQGYQCAHCEMNIHKACLRTVEEQCVGAIPRRGGDKISNLMAKIMPEQRKKTGNSFNLGDRSKRTRDDSPDQAIAETDPGASGDRAVPASGRPDQRRPDTVTEKDERRGDEPLDGADVGSTNSGPPQIGKKPASTAITRSESYRDHRNSRRHTREKRKHSDPNIPSSKVSDVDLDSQGLCNNNHSGSSSNSSLSARQESPSASLDTVSVGGRVAGTLAEGTPGWDSDMEVDADPPDWQRSIDAETRRHLRPKEKQRLDVVNELFHTERTHVRNLKVLVHLFNRPMINLNILQPNDINLLFGNLEELLEIHSRFNAAMKKRQKEDPMMEKVGDILVNMFEGEQGESFKTAAAAFCRCQSIALEKLKTLQKRDQRLAAFLAEAESDPVCRRLQLKDILPTAMQRLTKYPLLLTNLAKYTVRGSEDHALVLRCCEKSKAILEHVNKVKGETERHERLVEIQNKLEQNGFSRVDNPIVNEFNGRLDLTKYRMVHEGPVMWKFSNKGKHVELHMILLEEFIVLLQKQDDKYVLKFHTVTGREISPIVKNENILVRPMATEKRAFFILHNLNVGPQIYELLFASSSERDQWYRLIKEAADSYQGRDGKGHKRTESAHTLLQAQDSSEAAPTPAPAAADEPADSAAAPAGAEAALSPGATSPPDASPAASPTAPRSQLTAKAAAAADGAASPGEKRRMQRVEMLKIAECTQLIDPAEVVVSQGVVLSAEPVLTPIERLRRKDEQVRQTLAEKQQLVADILQIPRDDFAHIAELAAESGGEKDARELILNSILSVDRNMSIINETLKVTEGDIVSSTCTPGPPESPGASAAASAPAEGGGPRRPVSPRPRRTDRSRMAAIHQLLQVNSQLSATLTTLLGVMTERDEERERMRKELRYSHERIHQLHRESAGGGALAASPPAAAPAPLAAPEHDSSRPHSFVSVASSSDAGAAGGGGPAEHAETDEESSRSRPDTGSQESGGPASDTLEESTHETETFDSASSGSACLTFESAADQT
ncbi:rho guanine nucleotide exchange factor 11-like isoform X6 [Amphibalanus amphitrite]|uniref:rho guanine nucleotide exchange factor 11-like isoform X6 n=1 Tax=Amphibalanus amphitrite TaxID=1232801 RepID=UPI001C90CB6B|nr:rho guanine nucleotide exchange factor 11-like isoform X6 [Amphibalanus amphitrite]